MASKRKNALLFGSSITIALVLCFSLLLAPATHASILSEKTAKNITGINYTNSTMFNGFVNGAVLGIPYNLTSATYRSNSSYFEDDVFHFHNSTDASNVYGYLSISEPTFLSNIGNSTYRGFQYSFVVNYKPALSLNLTYLWAASGVRGSYVFDIHGSSQAPPLVNMSTVAMDQIDAMETPLLSL